MARRLTCRSIVAAALAIPASAPAVVLPTRPPFPYYQRFTIRISGTETTEWRAPKFYYYKTAYGLYWRESHGSERIWFNSGLARGFAYALSQHVFPSFEFGSFQLDRHAVPGLRAFGGIDRDGEVSRGADPGPAGGGLPASNSGPYDCRYLRREYYLSLKPNGPRTFALVAYTVAPASGPPEEYKNCPAHGGGGTVPGILWPIRERMPVATLFAGKPVVVRAHRRFVTRPRGASNLTATADVSWILTLTPER
jgi:hypothetical protein